MTDTSAPKAPAAMPIAFMIGKERVSFVLNSRHRSYHLKSQQGQDLVALLRAVPQDVERIGELADIITYIAKQSNGRVTVDDCDRLRLDGKLIDYGLSGRMAQVVEAGVPFDALSRFIEKVSENPDKTVAEDLYRFMEKGGIPLTPDGNILVFKKVDPNYYSYASGTTMARATLADGTVKEMTGKVLYPLGGYVEMDREDCDPNRQRTCSKGLHGCSPEYLNFWYKQAGIVLIGEVDPKDVTAIPADHNDQKLRCCRMKIVGEIPESDAKTHFPSVIERRYETSYPSWDLSDDGRRAGGPALDAEGRTQAWIKRDDAMVWGVTDDEAGEPTAPADAVNDRIPNAATEAALEAVEAGDVTRHDTVDDLMADLNAPDARTPLQFVATDEDDNEFDVWGCGHDEGLTAGRQDKANGYPADDAILKEPRNLDADDLKFYREGYAEGYAKGYAEPADETLADADGEGRWTLARALDEGRKFGVLEAGKDHSEGVGYVNDPWDSPVRDALDEWLEAAYTADEDGGSHEHPFAKAFERAYRDAYHTAWNAREDAA
ncbi:hypothetical protein MARCHEWKA_04910 [Brevundimonas phage vB_BpoS-Marchewka]|uniref:Uncharacterized protein n=1 Tax=Brevundimonas phage vB_BpoS-Marchewka TaxID=2948604 RepID=A0A9E7N3A0_9CAUD|nr:hypothetical protein MARCHEWKA_04910 [Brevundimonas phage vB_BpoS-Marchewka]